MLASSNQSLKSAKLDKAEIFIKEGEGANNDLALIPNDANANWDTAFLVRIIEGAEMIDIHQMNYASGWGKIDILTKMAGVAIIEVIANNGGNPIKNTCTIHIKPNWSLPVKADGTCVMRTGFKENYTSEQLKEKVHLNGVDISGPKGTEILASRGGKVVVAFDSRCRHDFNYRWMCGCGHGYGNYIILDHEDGYLTVYAHLSKMLVEEGEYVEWGKVIGIMGSTGDSTGRHLHFEICKQLVHGNYMQIYPQGGKYLRIDPRGKDYVRLPARNEVIVERRSRDIRLVD